MSHDKTLRWFLFLATVSAPLALSAQSGAAPSKPAAAKAAKNDTTIRVVIPDRDGVKVLLQGGVTYAAKIDGRELTIQVKPTVENLRDPAVGDASLPSENASRFTIAVEDSGLYEFTMIGVMPGRDVVMELTGPPPVKKKM